MIFGISTAKIAQLSLLWYALLMGALFQDYISFRYSLPHPALRRNTEDGFHWAVRRKERHLAHHDSINQVAALDIGWEPPLRYIVIWGYSKGVAPDFDNVLSSVKAHLDGISDGFLENDRYFSCVRVFRMKTKTEGVRIVFLRRKRKTGARRPRKG